MNKQKINYLIDLGMLIALILSIGALPLGAREVHSFSGLIFLVLFIAHFVMHWKIFIVMHNNK